MKNVLPSILVAKYCINFHQTPRKSGMSHIFMRSDPFLCAIAICLQLTMDFYCPTAITVLTRQSQMEGVLAFWEVDQKL